MDARHFLRRALSPAAVLGVALLLLTAWTGDRLLRQQDGPATTVLVGVTVLVMAVLAWRLLRHSLWDDSVR